MHRRFLIVLIPLIALAALLAPRALAQGTLDQSNTVTPTSEIFGNTLTPQSLVQTFTAGVSGTLDSAALQVGSSGPGLTGTVSIYATSGGLPVGGALASGTLTFTATPTPVPTTFPFVTVTFASGATVAAGVQYALVLTNLTGGFVAFAWADVTTNPYPGGQAFFSGTNGIAGPYTSLPGTDFDFQTFVTVVAPPAPVIVITNPPTTLGITIVGCGSITPSTATLVNRLQSIPVTAVPCAGSVFAGWTGGPCSGTKTNPCDIAATGTATITATFTP